MTEQDLGLKANVRRLFWHMGFSTRVDVPLRAYVPPTRGRDKKGIQEFTDLDVLGIGLGPDFRVQSIIADCKTSAKRSTERMFWVRGVADFFSADNAYLVRSQSVTAATRQLASRLEVSVVTPTDLAVLEDYHRGLLPLIEDPVLQFLFDVEAIGRFKSSRTNLDARLKNLLEYQEFDYWVYEEHRNLQQLIAHLGEAQSILDPSNPIHKSIFMDSVWLYVLTLARAIAHIRRGHLTDIDTALQEYLFGGQLGLREKQQLAAILRRVAGKKANAKEDVLPPYYPKLLELSTRLIRRPYSIRASLRYAEWLTAALVEGRAVPLQEAFGDFFDEIAGKLVGDVCAFLVEAATLPTEFRDDFRAILAQRREVEAVRKAIQPELSNGDESRGGG